MPSRPPTFRPPGAPVKKAWAASSAPAVERIRGRAGVKLRERIRQEEPLCRTCLAEGRVTATQEVDHIVPLSRGGTNDRDNFQGLCTACHIAKTEAEKARGRARHYSAAVQDQRLPQVSPSRIPVTIVCGPAGSGKSTYVREHARPGNLVIDLDAIMSSISGEPEHHTSSRWLPAAMAERNRLLAGLATDRQHDLAWFIIAAPSPTERALWAKRLGADLVVLATPLAVCIARIQADPARAGRTDRMIKAATEWWQVNQQP